MMTLRSGLPVVVDVTLKKSHCFLGSLADDSRADHTIVDTDDGDDLFRRGREKRFVDLVDLVNEDVPLLDLETRPRDREKDLSCDPSEDVVAGGRQHVPSEHKEVVAGALEESPAPAVENFEGAFFLFLR